MSDNGIKTSRSRRALRLVGLCTLALTVTPAVIPIFGRDKKGNDIIIAPRVPTADRASGNRVFLERADVLTKSDNDSFMVLNGNVEFTKGPMFMYCDSAHYYPDTESMNAFGNVRMEQGDTLFVYADELDYNGATELAVLYADPGKKVRLINRDVMLETDEFIYDLYADLGYYNVGGVLTDKQNRLSSHEGEYVPSTKEANFYVNVHLNSRSETDTLDIYTDTLYYNTGSHIAELYSPSEIINARGTIYTREGVYETDSDICNLYDRSTVVTNTNQTLTADTIYYNRRAGYGEARGGMVLTDTAKKVIMTADYGYYNELADSSFATGRALIKEYSEGDTLYLHGRYIETFARHDTVTFEADTVAGTPAGERIDTTHVAVIYPRVRFYRSDLQGICDSMRMTEADSTLRMFVNPVIWSENRQIFGNVIELHFNDSTVDRARLPEFGFTAEHIEDEFFNQISGKEMVAFFENSELRHLDISGNVEIIMYPEESDSTINKLVSAQSSFLSADFKGRTTEKIKMWPETTGAATPLFMARKSLFYLAKFKWFEDIRPLSPDDVFIVPDEMEAIMVALGRKPAEPEDRQPEVSDLSGLSDTPDESDKTDKD